MFTYYGLDPAIPIVPRGPSARWDGLYINPGGMLFHDGQFHMFRNGFKNWPGLVSVGYMTSPDGLTWTEVQEEPVFTSDQVPYVEGSDGADVSSVLVLDDGTWVMYFHRVSSSNPGVIGRATAPSPTGPWEVDPEPVLEPGPEGAWDSFTLEWPNVVAAEGGFVMFYSGRESRNGQRMIGRATSEDGITWTKYDNPSTTDELFAESDPVLTPEEDWTTDGVDRMRTQLTPEGWVMVYQGGALIKRGLAFSQDGIHWARHPENPVLELSDFPFSGTMWDTNLLYQDGVYYYFTEIGSMAGTDIYLAIHEGEIMPEGLAFPDANDPSEATSSSSLPDGVALYEASSLVGSPGSNPIYTRHINNNDLSLGTYTLAAGSLDTQPAHSEDEVYYVLEGEGVLDVDGEKIPVMTGSMVYVTALVPHHFEDIIQDLQVLVFFSKSEPGADEPAWLGFETESLAADMAGEAAELPLLEAATLSARLVSLGSGSAAVATWSRRCESIRCDAFARLASEVTTLPGSRWVQITRASG